MSSLQKRFRLIATLLMFAQPVWLVAQSPSLEIRVGYMANLTQSQVLIGLKRGDFQAELGNMAKVKPNLFNAGPSIIEAIFAGQIDLAYIGPNPAINGYVKSKGAALTIVAGATSGGASLVMRPDSAARFPLKMDGLRLASPQLGNTQDVALRSYLLSKGLKVREKGGTVNVIPMENSSILISMAKGELDGAWVPEPWASRLVAELKAVRVIDERDLWPMGKFSTTVVVVSKSFLQKHPDVVESWLKAHKAITDWEGANPDVAMTLVNEEIGVFSGGKKLSLAVLKDAWSRLSPELDPQVASLTESAKKAFELGFLNVIPDISKVVDRRLLDKVISSGKTK